MYFILPLVVFFFLFIYSCFIFNDCLSHLQPRFIFFFFSNVDIGQIFFRGGEDDYCAVASLSTPFPPPFSFLVLFFSLSFFNFPIPFITRRIFFNDFQKWCQRSIVCFCLLHGTFFLFQFRVVSSL